ncbi:MAG: SDR family NAD(P)-dependent oxidoreductase, partial [Oscillospiraceae bacterium]
MFPNRFAGKTMVITGGATGIGLEVAKRAAAEGANVVIGSRNQEHGDAAIAEITAAGGKAIFVRTDVTKVEDVKNLYVQAKAKYGNVQIAINNAGVLHDSATIFEMTDAEWDRVIKTNLYGMFYSAREAFVHMKEVGEGGSILNLGSVAGINGMPSASAYCASKHG